MLAALLALGALLVAADVDSSNPTAIAVAPALLVAVPVAAYLAWKLEPAWLLSIGIVLSPIAGNWPELGIPGPASPDRLLLLAGVGSVLLRPAMIRDRQPLRLAPVHWLMLAAVLYVAVSAISAGVLLETDELAQLIDAFGLTPFLVFLVAPVAFRYRYQRQILLGAFVVLGAYLGLTAIFERINADPLIFPRYILDPNVGFHIDRSRGPFVEAVANGFALFVCAVACTIASKQWRGQWRGDLAVLAGLLCLAGIVFTMQRSVWLAAGAAVLITVATMTGGQRTAIKALVGVAVATAIAVATIPGLYADIEQRFDDDRTIHDRENLSHAAIGMVEDRPLFGFGWSQFAAESLPYFEQDADFPLGGVAGSQLHSTVLTYAVELGLLGTALWVLVFILGVGGGLTRRGPPDVDDWRVGLVAVAVAFVVVTNFVPPQVFPNLALWMWAGIGWVGFQGPSD